MVVQSAEDKAVERNDVVPAFQTSPIYQIDLPPTETVHSLHIF